MEYITTKEASVKWGISTIRVTVLANEGRIPGAKHLGKSWMIPANASKPPMLKANHSKKSQNKTNINSEFSFPLYHFRPDWGDMKEASLTNQQKTLLMAETAVLECRFTDAYSLLNPLSHTSDDISIIIGSLWNSGICSIALNKPEDFSRVFLRLQLLLSEAFPHRNDFMVVLNTLKTYIDTMSTTANEYTYCAEFDDQCLPMTCLLAGYSQLSKEIMKQGAANVDMLELNLRLLETSGSAIVLEFMHLYLLGVYFLRQDMPMAQAHAKQVIQIAFENKYYLPLVTYYRYYATIMAPILSQYPEDFQNHCNNLVSQYDENLTAFISSTNKYSIISKLTDADFPYIYATLMDLPNTKIAERLNVSPRTAKRRLETICQILDVKNKKELKEYLQKNI